MRFALAILNIDHEYREVEVFRPREERDPIWFEASRFGEVPVLVIDSRPVVQSNAILLHLARTCNSLGWEHDPDTLTEWLFWEANRIAFSLSHIRFHAHFKVPIQPGVIDWLGDRLVSDLQTLDQALSQSPFLMGNAISAADIACSGYIFYADQVPMIFEKWPNVASWIDAIKSHSAWAHPYDLMVPASVATVHG